MEKKQEIHNCPLCLGRLLQFSPRYPKAICCKCADSDIKDNDGNVVSFHNIDLSGGFISRHIINNDDDNDDIINVVEKAEHICWVHNGKENIKCYANEARFGGIVIQVLE